MQTFLPYDDYARCAQVLDRQRLGKQRVEVLQLLKALAGETKGWANHPAAKMWRGHERALTVYGIAMCREWKQRGYKDTCEEKIFAYRDRFAPMSIMTPHWMGNDDFHASHRAVLLDKDFDFYSQYGWGEFPAEPDDKGSYKDTYVWPVA